MSQPNHAVAQNEQMKHRDCQSDSTTAELKKSVGRDVAQMALVGDVDNNKLQHKHSTAQRRRVQRWDKGMMPVGQKYWQH